MENYYNLSVEEIEKELNTNKEGLSDQEYDIRIEKYGFNELTEKKKESILVKFIEQFKDIRNNRFKSWRRPYKYNNYSCDSYC